MRLSDNTPAKLVLNEHLKSAKQKRGRPKTAWLRTIQKDLEHLKINIDLKNRIQIIHILQDSKRKRHLENNSEIAHAMKVCIIA